jgi:hypothetical protein
MKEKARGRITVTSSLYEISTDQPRNRVGVRGRLTPPPPFFTANFWTDI